MKRARLIYNPTSGREQVKRQLPYILGKLEQAGYETSTHATCPDEGDATRAARLAVEREFDLVIAAGGDGTIYEVINGMAEQPRRPKFGIIPAGTTNDFARALGVPRTIEKAVEVLCAGIEIPVDIGRVNDKYFVNIAGGGKLTELTYQVPSQMKTMIGQLAYYLKGMEMLPSIRPTNVKIEYDDKVFEGEIMLFLVANTNSIGGFEKLAPLSEFNDGYFDLVILKKANLAEFIRIATLALKGDHIRDSHIIYEKARHIKIHTDEKMQLNLDGEFGGLLPGEFLNLRHHFQMLVPRERFENIPQLEEHDELD
ncbi:diacylglycerol kinase [Pseudalkalibacillus decolorationis]|uniref:diacylglycerol kinase n=1 Tax=Pseudalkalibacillus decolorationis TaxID=163879 RepID=UPI0021481277|nr:diacylglycerol kinase [Pseudalkalibacillus decolorationis]